jgi:hypothetical protein
MRHHDPPPRTAVGGLDGGNVQIVESGQTGRFPHGDFCDLGGTDERASAPVSGENKATAAGFVENVGRAGQVKATVNDPVRQDGGRRCEAVAAKMRRLPHAAWSAMMHGGDKRAAK